MGEAFHTPVVNISDAVYQTTTNAYVSRSYFESFISTIKVAFSHLLNPPKKETSPHPLKPSFSVFNLDRLSTGMERVLASSRAKIPAVLKAGDFFFHGGI